MRLFFTILLLTIFQYFCFSQTKEKSSSVGLIDPFTLLDKGSDEFVKAQNNLKGSLYKFSLLKLSNSFENLKQKKLVTKNQLVLKIPQEDNSNKEIKLIRNEITTNDFVLKTSDGKILKNYQSEGQYYSGKINNNKKSIAAISFTKKGIRGIISDNDGNKIIEPLPQNKDGILLLYDDDNLQKKSTFNCSTKDENNFKENILKQISLAKETTSTCKTVKIYIECSYEMYLAHNNNINDVVDFVFSVYNASATIFKNDGINIQISEMFVWTTPTIYPLNADIASTLLSFQNRIQTSFQNGATINADIAHFVTPKSYSGGIVGQASGIGLRNNCGKTNGLLTAAISSRVEPFPALPSYSLSVLVFAHETGHMLGSNHTQNCNWPGGAIDNCSATEGGCPQGPAPVNGGTIMSYCHATNYGTNFNNGFGTLPSAAIRNEIENTSCISLCEDTICGNLKVRNISASINDTTLILKWSAQVTKYRVGIKLNSATQWQYYELINADSFKINKTFCEKLYEYSIAPFCSSLNKYGTEYISSIGDQRAINLKFPKQYYPTYPNISICAGDSFRLFIFPDTNMIYKWYRNGILQQQSTSAQHWAKGIGKYNVSATLNGCEYFSDTANVVRKNITASFTTAIIINELKVTFNATDNCSKTYLWDFGDGTTQSTLRNPIHIYPAYGIYKVKFTAWDADGIVVSTEKRLHLLSEIVDSLNNGSVFCPQPIAVNFKNFACRDVAYFSKDSFDLNNSQSILTNPRMWYNNGSNELFNLSRVGTLEFKLFPQRGLKKYYFQNALPNSSTQISDTGYVFNILPIVGTERNTLFLNYSKWGGVQVAVDSVLLGNIANGASGPLKLNEWNTIGISYGTMGIEVKVNGQQYATSSHIVDSARAIAISKFSFGTHLGKIGNLNPSTPVNYYKGFEGAIDLIRFSNIQKDFTFSASPAWQGSDTVKINKHICFGEKYEGLNTSGVYFKSVKTNTRCDSVTKINLTVSKKILVKDSLLYPQNNSNGSILITNIENATLPINYKWSNGETSRNLLNIPSGNYSLTISDSLGCKKSIDYNLYQLNSDKDLFILFPNPSLSNKNITLRIGTTISKKYSCTIYDAIGRNCITKNIRLRPGINDFDFGNNLSSGNYVMSIRNNLENYSIKLVIF